MKPRILLYDLETSANVAHVWGHYEQNVLSYVKEWELLAVGWKWLGEPGRASVKTRADFKGKTDLKLTKHLWNLLDQADVVIGHNSSEFDNKKSFARFAFHDMKPPSRFQSVDTCKIARSVFKFNSNKLDDLARHLGIGAKGKTGGFDLWVRCAAGDKPSLKAMGEYCRKDVDLLEKLYLKLRPFVRNHPNISLLETGTKTGCPVCGSQDTRKRGLVATTAAIKQQIECLKCGHLFLGKYQNEEAA